MTGIETPNDGQPTGALAESYSVRDGGRTYVFKLRNGLKFSDGTDITAADFAWSWARALSPRFSEGKARHVLGGIEGADEVLNGNSTELRGVVATDDRTLEVRLVSPSPNFLQLLAEPVATVLSQDNVEAWGFDWAEWPSPPILEGRLPWVFDELPVGTGPFAFSVFDAWEEKIVLERNPHYWGEAAKIDRLVFDSAVDIAGTAHWSPIELLRERTYDVVPSIFFSPATNGAQGSDHGKIVDVDAPEASDFLVLDPAVPVLQDTEFRRAMVVAAEAGRSSGPTVLGGWIEDSAVGTVEWMPADELLPEGNRCSKGGAATGISGRTSETRTSFDEARLDVRQSLTYFRDQSEVPEHVPGATSIWESELNLELEVLEVSQARRARAMSRFEPALRRVSVTPSVPGQSAYFEAVLGALAPSTTQHNQLSEMLAAFESEQDAAKRALLCEDIRQYISDQALVVPMFATTDTRRALVQPWLRGFDPPRYQGSRFKDVWIDMDHPAYFPLD